MKRSIFMILIVMTSCMSASKHYEKFLKKGGKEIVSADTISVTTVDTLIVDGDTTYLFHKKDTVIQYKNVYVPKTKFEIRHMGKAEKDSMQHIERMSKISHAKEVDSLNGLLKLKKEDNSIIKNPTVNKTWNSIIIILILILAIIISFKVSGK